MKEVVKMKSNLFHKVIWCVFVSSIMLFSACGKDSISNESSIDSSLKIDVTSEIDENSLTEIETTSNFKIDSNNYIGYWHIEKCGEIELTINSVTSSVVSFSIWVHGEGATDLIFAELNGNTASFQDDEISGNLLLEDNCITMCIQSSNIRSFHPNTEMKFNMRVLESVQKINNPTNSEYQTDTGEIVPLYQTVYGQINCKGQSVPGVATSYVCEGGTYSTVRKQLGDQWHIESNRTCYNYGILWYECYDSQDGDYYGWINSEYLIFLDSDFPTTTTVSNTKKPSTQTAATTNKAISVDKTEPVVTQPTSKYTPTVISEQIQGVNFRYINSFHKYYEYIDERLDFDFDIYIKYCNPSDYMTADSRLTGVWDNNSTFDKKDIGNLYFSAGTDDFAVFEVTFKGDYSGADLIYDQYGTLFETGIMFQRFNSSGTLIKSINGQTECMAYQIDKSEGTVNHTIYIGFYTSEVSSVDFIMFNISPDYEDA